MAQLFHTSTIKKILESYTIPDMDAQIALITQWRDMYASGFLASKTETESEQAFNESFFVQILGYTTIPHTPFTIDPKGKNMVSGQKADAILGYFSMDAEANNMSRVLAVVEVKDCKTSLDKPQKREGNLSPVQQGFKYKPQYSNCKRVIVSNFYEIRLYKDTMLDYEIWNLDDLLLPDNNFFNLRKFHYLLCVKHLMMERGESVTENLLSAVRIHQEQITKKFYQQYKKLRLELINDLKTLNPVVPIATIITKAQKIIDRLVFIFFCEDRGLLPSGKVRQYVQKARDLDFTPWELLRRVFVGVDKGSDMLDIPKPGYNGGLFAPDAELDNLAVSDGICHAFLGLGDYDFNEEISVNVLGHIFEQSISDLEELKIILLGVELSTDELGEAKTQSKRKKDGIFYTPEYIVEYIVKNSLGKYLEQKETALKEHYGLKEDIQDKNYDKRIKEVYTAYLAILRDIKVLDPACGSGAFLVKVYDFLYSENMRVLELFDSKGGLFDHSSMVKGILQNNIYGVDLNDESVEITKLSLWLKTAEKGKHLASLDGNIKCGNSLISDVAVAGDKAFDWEKNFTDVFGAGGFDVIVGNPPYVQIKKDDECYQSYQFNTDLYLMFFEKTLKYLVKKGDFSFGFITPRFFLVNRNCYDFRKFLLSENNLTSLVETSPFEDAQTECVIAFIDAHKNSDEISIYVDKHSDILYQQNINKKNILLSNDLIINTQTTKSEEKIIIQIEQNTKSIKEISKSKRGIEAGKDLLRNTNPGISCLIGQDIDRYSFKFENTFIDEDYKDYQRLKDFFVGDTLYLRRVAKNLIAYVGTDFAYNKNIYGMKILDQNFDKKYVLVLLNSQLLSFYYKNKFTTKKGDLFPEIQTYLYEQLPIKQIPLTDQQPFIDKADRMLTLHASLHETSGFVLRFLQSKFGISKISTKLSKFWELDFGQFLKELKGLKLGLDQEAELMQYFEKKKAEIMTMVTEIERTDRAIDDMVFDVYGLSEEERNVVKGG